MINATSHIHRQPRNPIVTWLGAALLLALTAGEVTAATEFTVTNTNDSGPGSLRQAIIDSNAFFNSAHDNTVVFNIPGSGVHSIRPASPLPPIKDLLIDGYTQPGSNPNSLTVGSSAVLTIELDGSSAGAAADGLVNLGAVQGAGVPNVTVRGLVINRFGGRGIHVTGPGGNGFPGFVTVQGCYIGTDASGTQALGNGVGIELGTDAQGVIGEQTPDFGGNTTPFPANRNLISGNLGAGIKIDSGDPTSPAFATLRGAYVGTDASGTMPLGNGGDGVQIGPEGGVGSQGFGSRIYLYDNLIAANGGNGIDTQGIGTQAVNNSIGAGSDGTPLGNLGHGAHFRGAASGALNATFPQLNAVGPGVANNGGAGVLIEDSAIVDVSGRFSANLGLGIDLAPAGHNTNDSGDTDSGPNEGLNYPVITSAVANAPNPSSRIQGTINSRPNAQIQVLLFLNTVCDPSGFGEALSVAGSVSLTTAADGSATFDTQLPFSINTTAFPFVVAQSRRFAENPGPLNSALEVSEFSGCFQVTGGASVPTLSISDVSVTEGNVGTSTATFTVSLSAAASGTVTVNYATADVTATAGSDYVAGSGTLSFAAGQATQTVTVTISGDTVVEPGETFLVNLSGPAGAIIADAQGQGTIVNDDVAPLPTLSIDDVSVTEGNVGTSTATFTVSLSAAASGTVTVNYATADATATAGSDYAAGGGTLSFAVGESTKTVTITINGDTAVEPNETFLVDLNSPSSATFADAQGQGTIVNDDVAAPGGGGGGGGALDARLLAMLLALCSLRGSGRIRPLARVTREPELMNRHWGLPMPSRRPVLALLLTLWSLHGCSKQPAISTPAMTADVQAPAASEPQKIATACELVTEKEMSAILGAPVRAEPNDRSNGKTECIYKPVEGISPYVEFSVEWGSGEGAMMGVGMAAQAEPGLASPYDGLGDQAAAVGPALMIRTGEDLVMLVFSGVDDIPSKAKGIFETAKARM